MGEVGHNKPLSRSGHNKFSNVFVQCAECNERMGSLTIEEYYKGLNIDKKPEDQQPYNNTRKLLILQEDMKKIEEKELTVKDAIDEIDDEEYMKYAGLPRPYIRIIYWIADVLEVSIKEVVQCYIKTVKSYGLDFDKFSTLKYAFLLSSTTV